MVEISPNSIPSTTNPSHYTTPSTNQLPIAPSTTTPPPTVYIGSTTPAPLLYESSTKSYVTTTTNYREEVHRTVADGGLTQPYYLPQTTTPPLRGNAVEYYSGGPQYEHYKDELRNPYVFQNGPIYPIDTNGQTYNGKRSNVGNGYKKQNEAYDGVSVTNDGFRYYIPRAYHEEQNLPDNEKSGSFGYIDPFGIRRVVYYNANREKGFQHRKNNRYVGFKATPYDPRPA